MTFCFSNGWPIPLLPRSTTASTHSSSRTISSGPRRCAREQDPADEIPVLANQPVSHTGDLWALGKHRLICGYARQVRDVSKLMGGECAAMVFIDPPYNLRVSSIQGRGKIRHREFVAAPGDMSREEFIRFLADCLSLAAKHSAEGSIHFVFMDWRHSGEMLAAGEQVYAELKNLVVWVKTNSGQGHLLSLAARTDFRFQEGRQSSPEQLRTQATRPQPLERLDLCRFKHVPCRPPRRPFHAPHRQA
jgi:hypothetical protein